MISNGNSKPMPDAKMIKISLSTYERLRGIGKMGDSFEDVISRLLDENEKIKKSRK